MRISLPVFGFLFGEETKPARQSDNSELSMEQRIKALKTTDPEAYAAIFGKGLTKGKKEVTDAHLATAQDERFANTFNALRNERITRVIREKAKAMRFMNPEDAVMFLSNSLTLNDDLEVVKKDDNSITTIDESLKQLAQMSPHLIRSNQKPGEGSPKSPLFVPDFTVLKPSFKRSQLQDERFYRENEKQILEAVREGRIIDDMK